MREKGESKGLTVQLAWGWGMGLDQNGVSGAIEMVGGKGVNGDVNMLYTRRHYLMVTINRKNTERSLQVERSRSLRTKRKG